MFSLRICFISVSIAGSSRSRLRCVRFTICVTPSCGSQCLRVKCVWNVRAHLRDHHGAIGVEFFLMWSIRQMPQSSWLAWQQAHMEATWRQSYTHVILVLPVGMKLRKRIGRLLYYVVSITAANCLICYCLICYCIIRPLDMSNWIGSKLLLMLFHSFVWIVDSENNRRPGISWVPDIVVSYNTSCWWPS